jgi:hypothetical protein
MARRPKDIGTQAETWTAAYMSHRGWPTAEKRRTAGGKDRGDINSGQPKLVVEVKADKGMAFPEFLRQTETERVNAGAAVGVCVVKPPGVGKQRMGRWWMLMSGGTYDALQYLAGSENFMAWWYQGEDETSKRGFKTASWFKSAEEHLTLLPGTKLKPGLKRISSTGWDMRFLYLSDGLELLYKAGLGTD